jgi:lipid A ethanolaminephosphotransferase
MFSLLGHADYTHSKGLAQENLLDVLTHAGVDVTWWENQTGDKAVAKRISLRNFSVENDPKYCVNTECRDQVMVDELGAWLDNVKSDSTLVLHQLGSHGPTYFARYSEEERVFRPDCRTDEFADCTNAEIVNAYDNTIIATDHMLAQVIDLLAERSDSLASSMIYMSDHGESLGEKGLYLHGMPYMLAPGRTDSCSLLDVVFQKLFRDFQHLYRMPQVAGGRALLPRQSVPHSPRSYECRSSPL